MGILKWLVAYVKLNVCGSSTDISVNAGTSETRISAWVRT